MALSLELINTFYLCALSDQLFNMIFICLFFLVTPCLVGVAQLCMKKNWTERERHNKIIIQSNNFISVHFSLDTGKYLFAKICSCKWDEMFLILGWRHIQDFLRITNSSDHRRVLHRVWGNKNWNKRSIFILLYIYIVISG